MSSESKTHAALQAHLKQWRAQQRKQGMETNPLTEHAESIRWLCAQLDATRATIPKGGEFEFIDGRRY